MMKKSSIPALLLLIVASPAMALGGYFGMGVGQSTARDLDSETTALVPAGLNARIHDTDTSLTAFLGYELSHNFDAELSYVDFGTAKVNLTNPGTGATGELKWRSHATVLSAVGLIPLHEEFALFGRAGVAMAAVKVEGTTSTGTSLSDSESSTNPVFGVGVQYGLNTHFLLRAEYDRFQDVGGGETGKSAIDVIGASAAVRF